MNHPVYTANLITYLHTTWIFSPNSEPTFPAGTLRKLTSHGRYLKPIRKVAPLTLKKCFVWLQNIIKHFLPITNGDLL